MGQGQASRKLLRNLALPWLLLLGAPASATVAETAQSPLPEATARVLPSRKVFYPAAEESWRATFTVNVLTRALALSGAPYALVPSAKVEPKARNFHNLLRRNGIDVVWSQTSIEREQHYRAVRIPLNKGLMGSRLGLIRESQPRLLAGVTNLKQLSQFSIGQLYAWSDTKILTHHGLTVVPGTGYNSLFRMLAAGRFDVFLRSVTEVGAELEHKRELGLMLDPFVLVQYPAAMYFFVQKEDAVLAQHIEAGLEAMLASGEFDAMFQAEYGDLISRYKLHERQLIWLSNPLLPEDTPLCRRELWWMDMCPQGAGTWQKLIPES
ncbi:transporter substrate-binding domain-containing protein [Simiduia sp. 21SJ11W-1]|uniref:substrate-binding periplasmic protein n=1 Tax=Simiduia sp. 21SJ11W-1 TaxID=2909669 RepID=UPI0020A05789|nr:transporter substrate-binding domain-containing protein [Simiduia sp. 21SJ11W-1]UTA47896.1 transporter substrate-binding domain-containing protein [Simiduia sp. 21SJ11W-1]